VKPLARLLAPFRGSAFARFLPVVVALLTGLAAALLAAEYIGGRVAGAEATLRTRYAERPIVVAARSLPTGASLSVDDVAVRQVPARFVPSNAVMPEEVSQVLGSVTAHALERGDPIQHSTVSEGVGLSLAQLVAPERRAVTLAVDEISGFAGLLAPGDSVDLLYIADPGVDGEEAPVVRPLLEAVTVLATGRATRQTRAPLSDGTLRDVVVEYATVALELDAHDAERLALAQKTGEITVLLRHPTDRDPAGLRTVRIDALHGRVPAPGRASANPVEIIVGGAQARVPARTTMAGG
jgi:pilus assembly protein CpaB